MRVALTHNLKRTASEAEAEFDTPETIQALCHALKLAGHEVAPIEVTGSIAKWLPQLCASQPDVVLNTAEGSRGTARAAFFPALFDSMQLSYTGSNARAQTLTQDKHLTKQLVAAAGVAVCPGVLVTSLRFDPAIPPCPVIIKPNFEGSSKGITEASVVTDPRQLDDAVARAMRNYPDGILIEEYVPGTDVTVGFLEGLKPEILTPCSYDIAPEWGNRHRLYDYRLKNLAPDEAVQVACPARVPERALALVRHSAERSVRALGLRGVARIDFRVRDDGEVFFVEANATPSLEPSSSLFVAARATGIEFAGAICHLVDHAFRSRPRTSEESALRGGVPGEPVIGGQERERD
jgi:D-alanine-D-alanine ligase